MIYEKSYDAASNKYTIKHAKQIKDIYNNDVWVFDKQQTATEEDIQSQLSDAIKAKDRAEDLITRLQEELLEVQKLKDLK